MPNSIIVDSTGKVGVCTTVVGGAVLDVGEAGVTGGELRLAGATSGNVKIAPPAVAGTNVALTTPTSSGTLALTSQVVSQLMVGSMTNQPSVSASSTRYCAVGDGAPVSNENLCRSYMERAATLKNLRINLDSAQPASGSLVFTVMKNGVATTLVVTIAAGSAAGWYSDTTNSVTVAAGDKISVQVVNNATSGSGNIGSFQYELRSALSDM
jgi:hypothetical protein